MCRSQSTSHSHDCQSSVSLPSMCQVFANSLFSVKSTNSLPSSLCQVQVSSTYVLPLPPCRDHSTTNVKPDRRSRLLVFSCTPPLHRVHPCPCFILGHYHHPLVVPASVVVESSLLATCGPMERGVFLVNKHPVLCSQSSQVTLITIF